MREAAANTSKTYVALDATLKGEISYAIISLKAKSHLAINLSYKDAIQIGLRLYLKNSGVLWDNYRAAGNKFILEFMREYITELGFKLVHSEIEAKAARFTHATFSDAELNTVIEKETTQMRKY